MGKLKYIRLILLAIIVSCPLQNLLPQEKQNGGKRIVEILHSNLMLSQGDFRRLVGEVSLRHKEMYMTCDSAHYFEKTRVVKAYSNIHIQKGDTLHIYGEYLLYNSDNEMAELEENVLLIDRDTKLYTDHIYYDMANEVAKYNTGGRILNKENTLTSISGIYYSETEIFNFKDSVKLVNPDYTMYSDTLVYDTKNETAYFFGPSEIFGDSLYAKCEEGWYDTKNKVSLLRKNALIDNEEQVISGDSLFYDDEAGFGSAFYNVTINDRTRDIILKGNRSWYYSDPEEFMITDSAQFIQASEDDYLYMHADSLWSVTTPGQLDASDKQLLRAWYGVRIFSNDLQGKCDSLVYSTTDSIVRLYDSPVLWADQNQLMADSILLFIKNDVIDRMELYGSAYVIEKIDTTRFNQIRGSVLTGYFRENEIYRIQVRGNAENIYYAVDEGKLVGVNQGTCATMDIYLQEGKITDIYMFQGPDGSLDPPLLKSPFERRYDSFSWLNNIRPKNRFDIFRETKE